MAKFKAFINRLPTYPGGGGVFFTKFKSCGFTQPGVKLYNRFFFFIEKHPIVVLGFAVCIIFFLINHFAISHLDVPLNVIKLKYSDDYFMSFLFRLDQGHLVLEFTYVYNDINILGLILPLSFSMHITINNFVLILVVSCLFVQSFLLYIHKLIIFYL